MKNKRKERFITIRSEGGLLPLDFLERIALLDKEISGLSAPDYRLDEHQKINEAINRAWDRILGCWVSFKSSTKDSPDGDPLTRETRERLLLPLFEALGYGRLAPSKPIDLDGRSFQISHMWQNVPFHLVGAGVELDRRTSGVVGAAKSAPHGLVQDFLNHSDEHLWAFLSNGRKLRILRDNVSLTRQAYIEFDLEGMLEGELFSDFRVLYLLCHESRLNDEHAQNFWLEKWTKEAQLGGIRVRDELGRGVEEAITLLGSGFLQHSQNSALRDKLKTGELSVHEYYRQVLRIVYRLLFLFVAEDRGVLLRSKAPIDAHKTYTDYYSTQRLRDLAGSRRGSHHHDLWQLQKCVFSVLGKNSDCPDLALPCLGSFLWSEASTKDLSSCYLSNRSFLGTLFALAYTEDGKSKTAVDFKNLRTEELGSIYEALLEMHPQLDLASHRFALFGAEGNERKKSGSYYTPASLVSQLLETAVNPLIENISKKTNAADLLLQLKICDPACGSGHFLLAAANRLARALAAARSEDAEPSPEAYRTALRDVVSHCIYGVDLNEMSVELCKVNLWLESVDPDHVLSFLDSKIKCGNSLLGATPALLLEGIPDDAFDPIEGDDNALSRQIKRANREQSRDQLHIAELDRKIEYRKLSAESSKIGELSEISLRDLQAKEMQYTALLDSESHQTERLLCDAWCAAFVWPLAPGAPSPVTRAMLLLAAKDVKRLAPEVRAEINSLRGQYKFFHWHLEFPEVFYSKASSSKADSKHGWAGGFDVVLGNPPWERIKIQEEEWFAARVPAIAQARTAAIRKKMIKELEHTDPELSREFKKDKRQAEGESHFVRKSGRYPLCGRGDINTYTVFAETMREIMASDGYAGFIVPSGIATDDTTKFFFRDLVETQSLSRLYDFENRRAIFPGVHRSYKFSLVTLAGPAAPKKQTETDFVFFALGTEDLADEEKHFKLSAADIALLNPNTGTCAIFRSKKDAELTKSIYQRVPVLIKKGQPEENPWGITFGRMFDMANDSELFKSRTSLEQGGFTLVGNVFEPVSGSNKERFLPLFEAKMIHQFDHRWATYEHEAHSNSEPKVRDLTQIEKDDYNFAVLPRYWVSEGVVKDRIGDKWQHHWVMGYRRVARTTDERSVIATLFPLAAVGDSIFLFLPQVSSVKLALCLLGCLNSLVLDYVARQKIGGMNLNYYITEQLPILTPEVFERTATWTKAIPISEWIAPRVAALLNLTPAVIGLQQELSLAIDRTLLRAELDAAYFHLYGVQRDAVEHILSTFPVLENNEVKHCGEYLTRNLVMRAYDKLALVADGELIVKVRS